RSSRRRARIGPPLSRGSGTPAGRSDRAPVGNVRRQRERLPGARLPRSILRPAARHAHSLPGPDRRILRRIHTFSTFTLDMFTMVERGAAGRAISYALVSTAAAYAALAL